MQIDRKYLEQLTRFEMAGNITPEEQKVLADAIDNDMEARRIYHYIYTGVRSEEYAVVISQLREEMTIRFAAYKRKRKLIKSAKVIGITASAIAAAVWLAVLLVPHTLQDADHTTVVAQQKRAVDIELRIGSAPVINLSKQQGQIQAGNVVLNNKEQQLSLLRSAGNAGIATLTVPNGKEYMLQLPDGSTIQINAATTVHFPLAFSGPMREITISGEAYLSVKKNAMQPFLVNLPHGKVQVLGTEFNINTYNGDKVALVTGSIKMKTARDSSLIKPGYEATITTDAHLQVDEFDPYDVLSWRRGEYPFRNASLQTVSILIERYYGIPVRFEGESTAQKFTGVISRKTPINNFLAGLKLTGFVKAYSFDKEGTLHLR